MYNVERAHLLAPRIETSTYGLADIRRRVATQLAMHGSPEALPLDLWSQWFLLQLLDGAEIEKADLQRAIVEQETDHE